MADPIAVSQAFLAEFWEGQDITPAAIVAHHEPGQPSWLERVQALLDEAHDLSDAELRRCTQGIDLLFHLAVVFREAGMLATPDASVEAAARLVRDRVCARWIERAGPAGVLVEVTDGPWRRTLIDTGKPVFWSPGLPDLALAAHHKAEGWIWEAEFLYETGPFWRTHALAFFSSFIRQSFVALHGGRRRVEADG